ncbi:MAG TPA: methyltransferase domain-containing protein [Pseudolabrys sp.]|nr:methyltransferase domain-containing protein [Pseudolabrys sp.]
MDEHKIKFEDGAAYERMMGGWSRIAGITFLDWVAPGKGLRWIDVGCGNGAFTQLITERCAPAEVDGVDPSDGQISFARTRSPNARFKQGDAMALPFGDKSFDIATMALVIFFVPEPSKGVAEMVRVLRPGGVAAAYAWDIPGGGFPWEPVMSELRALGHKVGGPPQPDASRIETMRQLWTGAGLKDVETREITVQNTYASFDDYFADSLMIPSIGSVMKSMASGDIDALKKRVRAKLRVDAQGRVTGSARANAAKGRVPG